MKTKKKHQKKDSPRLGLIDRPHLSLMAVQEKLGLFKKSEKKDKQDHDYLKNKPLGLI